MVNQAKRLITDMAFVLLNLAMVVMSCFLLTELPNVARILMVLLFLLLCLLVPIVNAKFAYRLLLTATIFSSIILILYVVLNQTGWIFHLRDFDKIKNFILSTRQLGVIVYLAIVIFQVVILPIPGAITVLIGVAIYGPFWAFILSTVGTFAGSLIAFYAGRSFGKRLVSWMCGEEKTEKYAQLLGEKARVFFVLMLLFPFFPDDILCMVAGVSKMSTRFFIISILFTRPIMIGVTAFLGSGEIIPFSGWGIPVWIAIFVVTIIIFVVVNVVKRGIESGKIKSRNRKSKKNGAEK